MSDNEAINELPQPHRVEITQIGGTVQTQTSLKRPEVQPTADQLLWSAIRNRTDAIGFNRYAEFINRLLCNECDQGQPVCKEPNTCNNQTAKDIGSPPIDKRLDDLNIRPNIYGIDAYRLLKIATEAFLIFESGVVVDPIRKPDNGEPDQDHPDQDHPEFKRFLSEENIRLGRTVTFGEITTALQDYLQDGKLPYLNLIVTNLLGLDPTRREEKLPYCEAILRNRFSCPSLLELIWSYWHEEAMLVQTMNAIVLRFQNRSRAGGRDPLANLAIDPLRPLNNLLWGFIQDEYNRLTVPRRAYEYDHHYGLTLVGKAVPRLSPADSRSKFIEGFHNLLYRASAFFREDADTTVISDGFSLLNALKEVHLLLAEGAHNQFGDLPWTSRVEMLIMQWLLARPEIRDFLRGRAMVPYREGWMGQVDTMKRLQGWTDTTITHFHNMGRFGEQILLSVRYGNWIDVDDQEHAKNWARYWRPEIQGYIHAYLAATGVDLAADITDNRQATERYVQPSTHLRNRLTGQRGQGRLPALQEGRALRSEMRDYAELTTVFRRRLPRY